MLSSRLVDIADRMVASHDRLRIGKLWSFGSDRFSKRFAIGKQQRLVLSFTLFIQLDKSESLAQILPITFTGREAAAYSCLNLLTHQRGALL